MAMLKYAAVPQLDHDGRANIRAAGPRITVENAGWGVVSVIVIDADGATLYRHHPQTGWSAGDLGNIQPKGSDA